MKVNIPDKLYHEYRQMPGWQADPVVVERRLARLIEAELEQTCAPGHETDPLTQCWTRHQLRQDIERDVQRAASQYETYAGQFLCVDLAEMSRYNDRYGHVEGDRRICDTANHLRECFPDQRVYRFSGNEFVAPLRNVEDARRVRFAEFRLKHSVLEVTAANHPGHTRYIIQAMVAWLAVALSDTSPEGCQIELEC